MKKKSTRDPFLVADLFCGAGGSSTGAEKAIRDIGRKMVLVCINHWPIAIETHRRNHPHARHYVEDVTTADPYKLVPEGYLDLLMASPECRFYSRARGGRPVHDQGRMNPWAILKWLTSLNVRSILIENVCEFVDWGPLLSDGRPDPRHKGEYFQSWFFAIRKAGYRAEWRFLNAADYGDATTRTRFFLIARKDRRPIIWPVPSHSQGVELTMLGQLQRWRAAREIIDWSNTGRSLLDDQKYIQRPLSENTRRRIARGLQRFGGILAPYYIQLLGVECNGLGNGNGEPFIMGKQRSPAYRSSDQPIPTITTDGKPVLIQTTAEPFVLGQQSTSAPRNVKKPLPTIATHGAISLTQPMMVKYYGTGVCHSVDEPVPTATTKDRVGLANPTIVPYYGNHKGKSEPRAHSVEEPLRTVTTENRFGLANPVIVPYRGERRGQKPRCHSTDNPIPSITTEKGFALANPVLVEVNHHDRGDRAKSVEEPLGTITSKRGTSLIQPFMVQWDQTGGNGQYTRSIEEPVPTIVTKQNTGVVESLAIGLVEPILKHLESSDVDARRLIFIDGEPYLLDIRFRMLTNLELARAMGFSDQESEYEFVGNVSEVTRQIGNAVPVNMARALVTAILKILRGKEVLMTLGDEEERIIRDNPKHLKCPKCGHEDTIYAAVAIPEGNGKYTLYFGSEADFCTKCDSPWGRNADPDSSDETDKKVDFLHRSSGRMKESLSIKNRDKVWLAFMKKETWIHLKRSFELWWHVFRNRS